LSQQLQACIQASTLWPKKAEHQRKISRCKIKVKTTKEEELEQENEKWKKSKQNVNRVK
jgi:hypothetical protein